MPIDARIPLGAQQSIDNPMETYGRAMSIAQMMQGQRIGALQEAQIRDQIAAAPATRAAAAVQASAELAKTEAERQRVELQNAATRAGQARSLLSGVYDDQSFIRAKQQIVGILGPGAAAYMGDTFDPQRVRSLMDEVSTSEQQIAEAKAAFDQQHATSTLAETGLHNLET